MKLTERLRRLEAHQRVESLLRAAILELADIDRNLLTILRTKARRNEDHR